MKKLKFLSIIVVLFVAAIISPGAAYGSNEAEFTLTKEEKAYIDTLGNIAVAVDDNFVPLSKYAGGAYEGASVELFEKIADTINLRYHYVMQGADWAQKVEGMKSGEVQILFPASRSLQREAFGCYSKSYYQTFYSVITSENTEVKWESIDDIQDASLGVVRETAIIEYLVNHGFKNNLVYFDSDDRLYKALQKGDITYGCQNVSVFMEDYFTKELFDLKQVYEISEVPKDYCFFFAKRYADTPLVEIFNRGIDYYNSSSLIDKYTVGQLELINNYIRQMKERNIIAILLVVAALLIIWVIGKLLDTKQKKEKYAYEARVNESAFLQAQIKPHFLYNTLSAIAGLCYTDAKKAGELTIKLSHYMSIIFQTDNCSEWIPLDREIRLIELYLEIEKTRHGKRLQYVLDIDLESEKFTIMPLLLQPIVENAVKHGSLQRIKGGEVRVSLTAEGKMLCAIIEDDGVGMDDETLQKIFDRSSKKEESAMFNIRQRLMMEGGNIVVESEVNKGTRVKLRIPMRRKKNAASDLCR